MDFHKIDEVPNVRLAHLLGRTTDYSYNKTTHTYRYKIFPIGIRRPGQGAESHEVLCGECGDHVEVTVASARRTRWRQRSWLAIALLVLVAGVANTVYQAGKPGPNTIAAMLMFLFGLVTLFFLSLWWSTHGVSVAKGQPGESRRVHSIREGEKAPSPLRARLLRALAVLVPVAIVAFVVYESVVHQSYRLIIALAGLVGFVAVTFVVVFMIFYIRDPRIKAQRQAKRLAKKRRSTR